MRSTTLFSWGAATRSQAGAGTTIRVGSYREGQLFVHVMSMSGTTPRLRPRWESAPGNSRSTAGPFGTLRSLGTLLATGISVWTLHNIGIWGRPAWGLGGTSANIKFRAWFVGSW
jgi:hypothetical protein